MVLEYSTATVILIIAEGKVNIQEIFFQMLLISRLLLFFLFFIIMITSTFCRLLNGLLFSFVWSSRNCTAVIFKIVLFCKLTSHRGH